MKLQKGIVKYKDRDDIVCLYGVMDDGKQYYFLDETDTKKFSNGNRIASTLLVEAIDPMVKASNIGLLDENGNEVIPFTNRMIKPVNDTIILVEVATPISDSVIEANKMRTDPALATRLVSTPSLIKERMKEKIGVEGRYLFNDQFSEVTICDIDGNNLVNDEYYSFVALHNDKLYLSKNTADCDIKEFSIAKEIVQVDVPSLGDSNIDVSDLNVESDVVENALNSVSEDEHSEEITSLGEDVPEDSNVESLDEGSEEIPEDDSNSEKVEEPIANEEKDTVENDIEQVLESTTEEPSNEVVEENVEADVQIPEVSDEEPLENPENDVQIPEVPAEEPSNEVVEDNTEADVQVPEVSDEETIENPENDVQIPEVPAEEPSNEVVEDNTEADVQVPEASDEEALNEVVEERTEVADSIGDVSHENSNVEKDNPFEEFMKSFNQNISSDSVDADIPEESVVETPDNTVDSGGEEEVYLDDTLEDSSLDSMFHGVGKTTDFEDDLEEESIFHNLTADSIVEDDYTIGEDYSPESDTFISDIVKSMNSLIQQNKRLKASLERTKLQLEKVSSSRKSIIEKARSQEQKFEVARAKIHSLDADNQTLKEELREAKKVIATQEKQLKTQNQGKEDLAKLLQDAKVLLDDSELTD